MMPGSKKILNANNFEASSLDQIKMTRNQLEFDQKN